MIASLVFEISYRYLKSIMSYWGLKRWKSDTHVHTHTHSHTSGRQLKIEFLNVLKYSEYSDTSISKKKISRKHSFLSEEAKIIKKSLRQKLFHWKCSLIICWISFSLFVNKFLALLLCKIKCCWNTYYGWFYLIFECMWIRAIHPWGGRYI